VELVNAGQGNGGCDTYLEKRRRSGRAHDFEPSVPARSSSSQWRSDISETTARARAVVSTALDRCHRSGSRACGPRGRNRCFMPLRVETGDAAPLG
jgi:hypothetical protein